MERRLVSHHKEHITHEKTHESDDATLFFVLRCLAPWLESMQMVVLYPVQ